MRYPEAVAAYESAERFVPSFPTLWLNKGIACRQLIMPGAKTPEAEGHLTCAISSFSKFMELRPSDPRGEPLYIQTLFDGDRFDTLASLYKERLRKNPADLEAVGGLIQVYTKSDKFEAALDWYRKKAELQPHDAEAQYAVGVFIWQQLFQRGGSGDKAVYDPRPADPKKPKDVKPPPLFSVGDFIGAPRILLADTGISHLEKALQIRPRYFEAMVYLNLLLRQKSMAYFSEPKKWEATVDEAVKWQRQATELQAQIAAQSGSAPPGQPPPTGSAAPAAGKGGKP